MNFSQAENAIADIEDTESRVPAKSFLSRQKYFALYRGFLQNKSIPDKFPELPPEGAENWLIGLTLKYRGALHTAQGKYEEAADDFQMALQKLDDRPGIFQFLRMTVCIEACHSNVRGYREKALELIQKNKTEFEQYHSFRAWYSWLTGESEIYPALQYWY